MKISIILPLFDRRTAGWQSLESAVGQAFPRERYEVIAVLGSDLASATGDGELRDLLARCDRVERTALDTADVANEVALYAAGAAHARGDVLLFMEGHTALAPNCCALIAAHWHRRPATQMAWAPRINHGDTPLGRLVSLHNLRHERRAAAHGTFSLGANSIVRRDLFERLGGFDPRFQRFGETAILQRARAAGIAIDRIGEPLATHFNDMGVDLWRDLVMQMGDGKSSYYDALRADGTDLHRHVRHPAYLVAARPWCARVLYPLFRTSGPRLLALAMRIVPRHESLGSLLYVAAVGATDLSGYCRARIRARRRRDRG